MSSPEQFGERLRQARESLGLSQTEFGAAVGITRKTQWNYEMGERLPDVGYLKAVRGLGVDLVALLDDTTPFEPPPAMTPDERELLALWRAASAEARRAVRGALVGAAPLRGPKQVFHAPVGNVVHGPTSIYQVNKPPKK